jgi:hypothetical protein
MLQLYSVVLRPVKFAGKYPKRKSFLITKHLKLNTEEACEKEVLLFFAKPWEMSPNNLLS